MSTPPYTGSAPRVFYGWRIVAAGNVIGILHGGFFFYGAGIFFPLLLKHLGAGAAALGGAIGLSRLQGGLLAPVSGWFIDRYGPRWLLFPGLFIMGLGFIALSRITHLWMLYVVFMVLSLGASAGGVQPVTVAVANWFIRRRSLAMGFIFTGVGIGGSLGFALAWLIETFTWQTTAVIAGLAFWIVGFPVALLVRHRPEQMGLLPDGVSPTEQGNPTGVAEERSETGGHEALQEQEPQEAEFTPRQALATRAFWMLAIAYAVWSTVVAVANIFQVTYFTEELGASLGAAAAVASAHALMSTPGRIVFGWLGDKVDTRLLLSATLFLQVAGLLVLSLMPTLAWVPLYLILFSPAYGGSIPLRAAIVAHFYGRRNFGTISGLLTFVDLPGTLLGPIAIGLVFDRLGSFRLGFQGIAVLMAVGAAAILFARRPGVPTGAGRT